MQRIRVLFIVVCVAASLLLSAAVGPEVSAASLRPAWSAGRTNEAGAGTGHESITFTNVMCPWAVSCNETVTAYPVPVPVSNIYDIKKVAAGGYNGLALKSDNTLWGWGMSIYGNIGTGQDNSEPMKIKLSNVVDIAAGGFSSMARTSDGSLWMWGANDHGQLGSGTLDQDNHPYPAKVPLGFSPTAMATNGSHVLTVKSDGTVWAWGYNDKGQVGTGSTRTTDIKTPTQVRNLTGVKSVAAGSNHSLVVKTDGTVWGWGSNNAGQLGNGTQVDALTPVQVVGLTNVVQIAAGWDNSMALDANGDVWTWGDGGLGESGRPNPTPGYPPLSSIVPERVPGINDVKMVAKGGGAVLAVRRDGSTWAWGDNSQGQLGVNDISYCIYPNYGMPIRCKNWPTQVPGMDNPASIALGDTFALVSNGGSHQPINALIGQQLMRPVPELFGFWMGQMLMADPVDTATGNFVHHEVDLVAQNGAYGLDWARVYNSRQTASSVAGPGWSTTFSDSISVSPQGDAQLQMDDGRTVTFTASGTGFLRPRDVQAELQRLSDGTWRLGWLDGNAWTFDASGRLTAKTSWAGQSTTAAYDAEGRLASVTASTGETLTLTYVDGRLVDVAASDGRHVGYTYEVGHLATATTPATGTTTYAVDGGGRIASITDASGTNVVTNTYDGAGRVLTQVTGANGSPSTFSYEDAKGTTRVVDGETGQTVTYTHDSQGRIRGAFDPTGRAVGHEYDSATGMLKTVKNRVGGTLSRTFDPRGNVTTISDPKGVTRTAGFDDKNRVLTTNDPAKGVKTYTYSGDNRIPDTIADAAGRTTRFTSNAGLVTSQTDPDGVVTTYEYDANRRLRSKTVAPGTPLEATTTYTYDSAGRILTETDPLDHTTTYTYDGGGHLLTRRDPLGHTTTHTYDEAGRHLTTKDATNQVTTRSYDDSGRLASIRSPRGMVTTYGYDALGQQTSTTFEGTPAASRSTVFGPLGRQESTIDELGRATSLTYDGEGNVTATTDPAGAQTSTTFDTAGRVVESWDALGRQRSAMTYDPQGRASSQTALGGITTSFEYDVRGQLWKQKDARGGVKETLYTDAGRVRSELSAAGVLTTYTYDAAGRLSKETTPSGETIHEYDLAGQPTKTTAPGGLVTSMTYDAAGRLTSRTDPAGVTTTFTYTDRDEVETETRSGEGAIRYGYDPDGNLTSVTDGNGRTTTYGYDSRNRRTSQTDPAGKTTTWTYDAAGQLTGRTDPLGRTTTFTYDAAGRLVKTTDPTNRSETRAYDAAGQLTGITYADGSAVSFTYDSAGRRATATDSSGTTTYGYEAGGNLASVVRPGGRATSYAYDTAGRRTAMTLPDGTAYRYAYDTGGRLSSVTPAQTMADSFTAANGSTPDTGKWTRTVSSGATATVQANALSLFAPNSAGAAATVAANGVAVADGEVVFTYRFADVAAGAVLQSHVRSGADSYSLDIANDTGAVKLQRRHGGEVTTRASATIPVDTTSRTVRLRFDGSSIQARIWPASEPEPTTWTLEATDNVITAAGTVKLAYARTKAGHTAVIDNLAITDLRNPPRPAVALGYGPDGNVVTESLPNGSRTWTWENGRVVGMAQDIPDAQTSASLTYDAAGRVAGEASGGVTTAYGYDLAGQLTSVTPSNGPATSYEYDTRGRRTKAQTGALLTTYAYDDASQLLTAVGATTTTYAYDGAGRRTSETSTAGTTTYTYNQAGLLSSYSRGGTTQSRVYDVDRVLTSVVNTTGATTAKTAVDWDVAADLPMVAAFAGAGTKTVIHGPGGPASFLQGGTAASFSVDVRGSALLTPATSGMVSATGYDAWGTQAGPGSFEPRLGYRGEIVLDGLVHLRARNYQPSSGVFTTADQMEGVPGTPVVGHRYHYADNNPVNNADPTGLLTGVSGFVAGDAVWITEAEAWLAQQGAAGSAGGGLAGSVARVGGAALIAGVAIFGSTTGIDLPDLPGNLPNLPKICVLWCDSLEDSQQDANEALANVAVGWDRANRTRVKNHPNEVVVIFREVKREVKNGVPKRMSPSTYRSEIRYDEPSGVSFFEEPGLRGTKPGMFPLVVYIKGGYRMEGIYYPVVAPFECSALYSPWVAPFHWDVNCGGSQSTKEILGEYGSLLFNPPLPNPAYMGA